MKKIFCFSAVVLVLNLVCAVHAFTEKSVETPQDHTESILANGRERTFRIYTPSTYDGSKKVSLLIVLHGGGGSGEKMQHLTENGFDRLADREGFLVIYPDGVKNHWNDGSGLSVYRVQREHIDDVGFFDVLIDALETNYSIDSKRIYVAGISNGAMMAMRLACELSDRIAAVAGVAGALPVRLLSGCRPSHRVSVLLINGDNDPFVPWDGGVIRVGLKRMGRVLSVFKTTEFWAEQNACSSLPLAEELTGQDPQDDTHVQRLTYPSCRDNADVVLYKIENGGHTWPGGKQYLRERAIGKTSRDIDAVGVIWEFFKAHSKS
ncbi:MAG: PHB depolymerase family esterase [Candidatus Omnitrophota bacterium]